tara:strand:- start:34 stop:546 length:513 start_codon:yes stop_codon:yes gene_type:complete
VPDTGHIKSNGKEYKMSSGAIRTGSKAQRARNVAQGKLEDMKNEKLATGAISAKTTKAGEKPLSMSAYRSMSDKERATEKLKASQMYRAGQITKAEMEAIHDAVDEANLLEKVKADAKKTGKKKVTLPKGPKGTEPEKGAGKAALTGFNKGGMPSRKGSFDYRKGGLFAK